MGKNIALILAAGQGKRMGAGINKQFLTLQDKPVLYHTLKAFSDNSKIDEIVLVWKRIWTTARIVLLKSMAFLRLNL